MTKPVKHLYNIFTMSLPKQLYKLQQLDIELQKNQQLVGEITQQLSKNSVLIAAESKLSSQKQQLTEWKKKQKTTEWELDDLQDRVNQLNSKLYNGTVKNPKELVNLKHESENLKSKIGPKEDDLLELLSQIEDMAAMVEIGSKEIDKLKQEWEQTQEILTQRKIEAETALTNLKGKRQELLHQITPEALSLYEHIKLAKGQAIAKIEQGKCQGCYITVPTSQWQRAKAGDLVQCNSCTRILYVE
ncbi:MAG: hypothetical protein J7L19_06440 [Dehalococcoidia bacterium]|nr:hypothetical protein [Dehalococcoidia bacterium]